VRWLVTGGAGFIGSHLVDAIVARGLGEVLVLDSFRRGRRAYLAQHDSNPLVTVIEGDIRNAAAVTDACRGADAVVHLAARSNVIGSESDFQDACETNVAGTLNVLDAAHRAGVSRVVFSSSREVYGDPAVLPVPEDAPHAPKNLYGASKAAGELYCSIYQNRGLDVRVLRLSNVYGPRDTERVLPIWLERAEAGLPLQVFGGRQVLDLIWIDVVIEALLRAAQADSFSGPINIGCGQGTPILALAEKVIEVTGTATQIEMLPAREMEVVGYVADIGRMRQRLGIEPPPEPLAHVAAVWRSRQTLPVGG
jgi:UDP-glucose 4-epimerase